MQKGNAEDDVILGGRSGIITLQIHFLWQKIFFLMARMLDPSSQHIPIKGL